MAAQQIPRGKFIKTTIAGSSEVLLSDFIATGGVNNDGAAWFFHSTIKGDLRAEFVFADGFGADIRTFKAKAGVLLVIHQDYPVSQANIYFNPNSAGAVVRLQVTNQ